MAFDGVPMNIDPQQPRFGSSTSVFAGMNRFPAPPVDAHSAPAALQPVSRHDNIKDQKPRRPSLKTADHIAFLYIATGYIQLLFNAILAVGVLYVMFVVFNTIRHDIDQKAVRYSAEVLEEIALCTKQFVENKCEPVAQRLPALFGPCSSWETCMSRDPTAVGVARVSAETFAEILNGFVEPISLKTMLFFALLVIGATIAANVGFNVFRAKLPAPQQHDVLQQTQRQQSPGQQQLQQLTPIYALAPTTPAKRRSRGGGGYQMQQQQQHHEIDY